jgi:HAD superfamily hydrolase (TIGR01509 family)
VTAVATLFDFNGVLIDDELVHFAAFRDVVAALGIVLERETYDERYLGFDDAGAFEAMLVDAGKPPSPEDVERLIEAKKPVYMERIATELRIFEGAKEIVLRRAALGTVGIVSGALRHEIEHALGVMGVRDRFAFIVSAEDTTACKPDPEGYLLGLRALGREGNERGVAVIEDSLAGVAAAKHAKLRCAAVAHSYPADRLVAAGADAVARTIAELTDAMIDG